MKMINRDKMRRSTLSLSLLALLLMALVSCRSTKGGTKGKNNPAQPTTTVTTSDPAKKKDKQDPDLGVMRIPVGTNFTSKVRVTLVQNGKDVTTNGTLRMRYDDVIQLTLVDPVLGMMEVGRLELSPDNVLILDRVNKRYVSTSYEDFTALKTRNISFKEIQDFFWKEAQGGNRFSYTIPSGKDIRLDLQLSDKGSASNWTPHTNVPSKYTKTDVNKLFESMVGK